MFIVHGSCVYVLCQLYYSPHVDVEVLNGSQPIPIIHILMKMEKQ